jgi:hypothetical protein
MKKLSQKNRLKAYERVKANTGKGRIDGIQVDELLPFLRENQENLIQCLVSYSIISILISPIMNRTFVFTRSENVIGNTSKIICILFFKDVINFPLF